eukprot:IDg502t1
MVSSSAERLVSAAYYHQSSALGTQSAAEWRSIARAEAVISSGTTVRCCPSCMGLLNAGAFNSRALVERLCRSAELSLSTSSGLPDVGARKSLTC